MPQNLYRFDVFVNIDSNKITPQIGNDDDGKEIGHTAMVPDVRMFDVEAAGFKTIEAGLDLPPEAIHLKGLLRIAV